MFTHPKPMNQRSTTHTPHVPYTTPYAWEVHWWAPQSWVISPPSAPIFTLRAGPSHLSARSERYLRNAFELEGAVWCVLISGRSLMRLSKRRDPQRPAIYRRGRSANNFLYLQPPCRLVRDTGGHCSLVRTHIAEHTLTQKVAALVRKLLALQPSSRCCPGCSLVRGTADRQRLVRESGTSQPEMLQGQGRRPRHCMAAA